LRIVSSARDDKLLLVGVDRQVDGLDTFQDAINAGRRLLETEWGCPAHKIPPSPTKIRPPYTAGS